MKKLLFTLKGDRPHWVGDGFPVRTIFSYSSGSEALSPFLMMDYAAPVEFPPSEHVKGVGEHPHRGFETVTIVYSGEIEHRDSSGGGGLIGPGDVQWMTAGSGLVHEEKHGRAFSRRGGPFEMVQLWVNLPARHKMSAPHYQGLTAKSIPTTELQGSAGSARVIAGQLADVKGPARTFTEMNLWDLNIRENQSVVLRPPASHNVSLFVMSGQLKLASGESLDSATLGVFEPGGEALEFTSQGAVKALLLSGEPIAEPVVGYGPFVMNSPQEIQQAIEDFRSGRMGRLGN